VRIGSGMIESSFANKRRQEMQQALLVWVIFIALAVIINGTIPYAMGADLRNWSQSTFKITVFSFVIYAGLFLVTPLILIKG
jgi:hypothetical protein